MMKTDIIFHSLFASHTKFGLPHLIRNSIVVNNVILNIKLYTLHRTRLSVFCIDLTSLRHN